MEADPDTNDVLYIMARSYNKMRKITVNSSRTGYTLNWDKGRYRYMGVSTASNTFFYYPWELVMIIVMIGLLPMDIMQKNSGF